MQFEVSGQVYFLDFIPEEGRWFLLKPTRGGMAAMPVVNDDECMLFPDAPAVGPNDRDIVT